MLGERRLASNGDSSSSSEYLTSSSNGPPNPQNGSPGGPFFVRRQVSMSILVVDYLKVGLAAKIYDARPAEPTEAANARSFERIEVDLPGPVSGKMLPGLAYPFSILAPGAKVV